MTPHRVQLSRRKGWRLPENTVVVSRPSDFSNPYTVLKFTPAQCVRAYRYFLKTESGKILLRRARVELRGKHLACWCALDAPCHADVLLKLANA